jgi:hypothetical protein
MVTVAQPPKNGVVVAQLSYGAIASLDLSTIINQVSFGILKAVNFKFLHLTGELFI